MSQSLWNLTSQQVIESPEVSFLIFHNVYPEGKQGGLEIIHHGERIATNGDLRLESAPGQWSQLPMVKGRSADQQVKVQLAFTESDLAYTVRVIPEGDHINVVVDLDQPLSEEQVDEVGFNLELLPTAYYGKSYVFSTQEGETFYGCFPQQANGPSVTSPSGEIIPLPLARGSHLIAAPEDPYCCLEIHSQQSEILLIDGRNTAQNNWFILRSRLPAGVTQGAVQWTITPGRVKGWMRTPAILLSQVGYHPDQEKQILIELDSRVSETEEASLVRVSAGGMVKILSSRPEMLGRFLRYQYARFDITDVREPGIYQVRYGQQLSPAFRIGRDVYQEGVWQPTLETFMPVQMCHVRVEDIYRIWHGACHLDDALQAPTDHVHFDGYHQYEHTDTPYRPFDPIPGLDQGGWHDAGDYDLATGSQASTTLILALTREAFGLDSDQTTVRREDRLVLLHTPDGVPDIVQQVAHGVDFLLSGYQIAGHSLAGVIEGSLKQYVHLGDAATMTDNLVFDASLPEKTSTGNRSSTRDDRWAFTNQDTCLEYQVAAALASSARVLAGFDDILASKCLETARGIWEREQNRPPVLHPAAYIPRDPQASQVTAAVELLLTTGENKYAERLVELLPLIENRFEWLGSTAVRAIPAVQDDDYRQHLYQAAQGYLAKLKQMESESPFRLPFSEGWLRANRPGHDPFAPDYHAPIWGIGWNLQHFATQYYFLARAFPDLFDRESLLRVLNYVLGWHPANNLSLVSGVGSKSLTIAYGTNRAEWSYIPGGVASGPALVRPDLIELMDPWPWLWQQKEYVISGAASYIFLVLAADRMLNAA